MRDPRDMAQAQLDEYNARDLEGFVACYSPDVVVSRLPSGRVLAQGRDALRATYGKLFTDAPDLHCELLNRIVHGRCVVDHEEVTGMPGRDRVYAVAIYEVDAGLIRKVWFLEE